MLTTLNPHYSVKHQHGFTLIELLVAISIFLIMTGIGSVSYRNFNQRQQLQQSVGNLQEGLRFAQKKARVGEKPSGCNADDRLEGYSVRATANGTNFEIYAECRDIATGNDVDIPVTDAERLIGATQFALSSNLVIFYKVLTGGTTSTTNVAVTLRNNTLQYRFIVNQGGEISEGDFLP